MTIRDAIRETADAFARAGIGNARLEAEWLCETALGLTHAQLALQAGRTLAHAEAERIRDWTARRAAGEPLQYVLGDAEFCGLRIEVGPGVLIPRPETEGLVELALKHHAGTLPVLDLCTGSGCVALAIAAKLATRNTKHETRVYAVDISPAALRYARLNQTALGIAGVKFLEGDLYAPLPPGLRFAVITANPPYIAPPAYDALPPEVKEHEPELALRAEEDGLAVFRRIAEGARGRLLPGGWLFCELDTAHGDAACNILSRNGFTEVSFLPDSFGKPRFAAGRLPRPDDGAGIVH
jgi:release factor glutamine methyltransferase